MEYWNQVAYMSLYSATVVENKITIHNASTLSLFLQKKPAVNFATLKTNMPETIVERWEFRKGNYWAVVK